MSSHKPTYEVYNGVSTEDVPSAGFGWSRFGRTGIQIAGWLSVFVLLMYHFGNHTGHVETVWLTVLAVVIALGLIIHLLQPKLPQVRTVTARNQPPGHQEPDWMYEQKTSTGHYAQLTDAELRAINIEPSRVAHLRSVDSAEGRHAVRADSAHRTTVAPAPNGGAIKASSLAHD
ncbi:membrane protein [Corynebacterium phocae]|uniref:Membrane protein n=1 Tax=Corynebacterium phocae TaxID=161895 RepID=A0A1L7D2W3_9CORY|nr:DUF2631 domain-containing protein [Corynebacterium phocae]APT92322.1 membrane protein [Corynebacterium phocae]KAA8724911.1 DUF2631 domain-containing protein [Corynebacterium phocae]